MKNLTTGLGPTEFIYFPKLEEPTLQAQVANPFNILQIPPAWD